MSAARDHLHDRLEQYDAEDLRAIVEYLAGGNLCGVIAALDFADWHIRHGELCSHHIPALEDHTKRAMARLAAAAAEGTAAAAEGTPTNAAELSAASVRARAARSGWDGAS